MTDTRCHTNSLTHRGWLAALAVLAMGLSVFGLAAPSFAATGQISIVRTSPAVQPSGQTFAHTVSVSCSDVSVSTCSNLVVHFPQIGIPATWSNYQTTSGAAVASAQLVGGEYLVALNPIVAGDSVTFNYGILSPQLTTPNGEGYTVQPYLTGDTISTVTAAAPVSGSVTATVAGPSSVTRAGLSTGLVGQDTSWTSGIDCLASYDYSGRLLSPGPFTIITTFPAGTTLTSALPAGAVYDPVARTITTVATCDDTNDRTIAFTLGTAGIPDGTILTVSTDFTGLLADGTPTSGTSSDRTTIVEKIDNTGVIMKDGYTDYYDPTHTPIYSTPAGAWKPNTITYQLGEKSTAGLPNSLRWDYTDNFPCLDAPTGGVYTGTAIGAAPCQRPAFHLTKVSTYIGNGDFPAGWAPVITAPNGSTTPLTGTIANGTATYTVPAGAVASSIYFPAINSLYPQYVLSGYADQSLSAGSVLRNTTTATFTGGTVTNPLVTTPPVDIAISANASVFYVYKNGRSTDYGAPGYPAGETYRLFASGSTTVGGYDAPIVIADLLPAGVKSTLPPGTTNVGTTAGVYPRITASINGTALTGPTPVTVIDNYNGTGRQLVRYSIPVTTSTSTYTTIALLPVVSLDGSRLPAGEYPNTMSAFYTGTTPALSCSPDSVTASTPATNPPLTDDPFDLNGDGSTTTPHCDASFTITRTLPYGNPGFQIVKTVQGDMDNGPQQSPAVGHVSSPGGTATYRVNFRNTGGTPLNTGVVYDLLPTIGDTGISQAQADSPRGSEYQTLLGSVDAAPAGTVIEYSTATNPCRPEVFPDAQNPGCVNDWTATAPTDLSTVTGLRMRIIAPIASGAVKTLTFTLASPGGVDGKTAWNTAAGSATDDKDVRLLSSEPPKVGLTPGIPAMTLDKTVDATDPVEAGDTLTYTVTVRNTGNLDLPNVVVHDRLPAGLSLTSPGSATVEADGTLTWRIDRLAIGATQTFNVQATVDQGLRPASLLTNTAFVDVSPACTITGCTPPPTSSTPCPADATQACATVRVAGIAPEPGVAITKTADRTDVLPGDTVTYAITATNTGNTTLTGLNVTDTLPDALTAVTSTPTGTTAGGTLTWRVDTLASGESVTFIVTATVAGETTPGPVVNRATVASDPGCAGDDCAPPASSTTACRDDATAACASVRVTTPATLPTPPALAGPTTPGQSNVADLAHTGSGALAIALGAGVLLLLGGVLMWRRRARSHQL